MKYPPNCYLTADVVLIAGNETLLIRRKYEPFEGSWAFPGGFVEDNETVIDGAARELEEETGVTGVSLTQFGTYADPGRDPRGRTVAVVYWAILEMKPVSNAGDDAADCGWFPLDALPGMAFDHGTIAADVLKQLRSKK